MRVDLVGLLMIVAVSVFVLLMGALVLVALRLLTGRGRKRDGASSEEETRMMQEIYHGLAELGERVEALETLLVERQRKDGS